MLTIRLVAGTPVTFTLLHQKQILNYTNYNICLMYIGNVAKQGTSMKCNNVTTEERVDVFIIKHQYNANCKPNVLPYYNRAFLTHVYIQFVNKPYVDKPIIQCVNQSYV